MRHAPFVAIILIPLLFGGAACEFNSSWRAHTNLPDFEGACVELTAACPILASGQGLSLVDPSLESFFPDNAGALPAGQRLKIYSVTRASSGSGFRIVATVIGGARNGDRMNIGELFDSKVTPDAQRETFFPRPTSLKLCASEKAR